LCVESRAEEHSAFLQVSFTYAKIFLAAFVKKRKKTTRLGQFHFFFPIVQKKGLILLEDTDRFEVTTTGFVQNLAHKRKKEESTMS